MEQAKLFINSSINLELILLMTMAISLTMMLFYYKKINNNSKLLNVKDKNHLKLKSKSTNKTKYKEGIISNKFKKNLETVLIFKNKESKLNLIMSIYSILIILIFIFFLSLNSIILAIIIPIIVYVLSIKILQEFVISFDVIIYNNFPVLVNHMIKHFTKTNDLSIVLYNSSKEVEEPLRSLLLTLSREIITNNDKNKFYKLIEETDNLWLHAFLLTLINYKENSSKENVIGNLIELSKLIEKRRNLNTKMINDRKPVIIINYLLLVVGIIISIGNAIINPTMKTFINTPTGIVSVIIGVSCMFLTILINKKLSK